MDVACPRFTHVVCVTVVKGLPAAPVELELQGTLQTFASDAAFVMKSKMDARVGG